LTSDHETGTTALPTRLNKEELVAGHVISEFDVRYLENGRPVIYFEEETKAQIYIFFKFTMVKKDLCACKK